MGLFGRKAEPPPSDALSEAEAIAGIAVCALYADGVLSPEEDEGLNAHLSSMKLFRGMADPQLRGMFLKIHACTSKEGEEPFLDRAAAAIPPRLRPTAYLLAADLLLSDEEFGADERRFLEGVQRRLGVEDGLARKILEVLELRQLS